MRRTLSRVVSLWIVALSATSLSSRRLLKVWKVESEQFCRKVNPCLGMPLMPGTRRVRRFLAALGIVGRRFLGSVFTIRHVLLPAPSPVVNAFSSSHRLSLDARRRRLIYLCFSSSSPVLLCHSLPRRSLLYTNYQSLFVYTLHLSCDFCFRFSTGRRYFHTATRFRRDHTRRLHTTSPIAISLILVLFSSAVFWSRVRSG